MKTIDIIPELIEKGDRLVCVEHIPYFRVGSVYEVEGIRKRLDSYLVFYLPDVDGDITGFSSSRLESDFKLVLEE